MVAFITSGYLVVSEFIADAFLTEKMHNEYILHMSLLLQAFYIMLLLVFCFLLVSCQAFYKFLIVICI